MPPFPAAPAHITHKPVTVMSQQPKIALNEQCSDGIEAHVEIAVGHLRAKSFTGSRIRKFCFCDSWEARDRDTSVHVPL